MSATPITVLYDADCGFCRATLAALLRWDRRLRLLPEAIQSAEGQRLLAALPVEERLATAHAVTPDGRVFSGGDVAAPVARLLPGGMPVALLARALAVPTRLGYRVVAGNRTRLSRFVSSGVKDRAACTIERHRRRVLSSTRSGAGA